LVAPPFFGSATFLPHSWFTTEVTEKTVASLASAISTRTSKKYASASRKRTSWTMRRLNMLSRARQARAQIMRRPSEKLMASPSFEGGTRKVSARDPGP
jgi:hypothetical protein